MVSTLYNQGSRPHVISVCCCYVDGGEFGAYWHGLSVEGN